MKYNYFIAKRNFDENWENLSRVYAEAGMSPEAIQEMHDYDWAVFREQRNIALHEVDIAQEERETIMEQFQVNYDVFGGHSRYWWLEELTTPCLTMGVPYLKADDKELLTLYIYEQHTIREIAEMQGVTKSSVLRHLRRIFSLFPTTI